MRLETITPVILTYNEAANIGRCLSRLAWAADIVVVDSGSTDETQEIARRFPNVRLFSHGFENHTSQWLCAIRETAIATDWILTLDSDYIVSDDLIREIEDVTIEEGVAGYAVAFRYRVLGHALSNSIYPPRVVLCRKDRADFYQDGHTQRLVVSGDVRRLSGLMDHNDRKPLTRWVTAQDSYARLERDKILSSPRTKLRGADRIRAFRLVAPLAVLLHCLFVKRLIFQGFYGWYYTYQRVMAELILSLYLLEDRLAREQPHESEQHRQGE